MSMSQCKHPLEQVLRNFRNFARTVFTVCPVRDVGHMMSTYELMACQHPQPVIDTLGARSLYPEYNVMVWVLTRLLEHHHSGNYDAETEPISSLYLSKDIG